MASPEQTRAIPPGQAETKLGAWRAKMLSRSLEVAARKFLFFSEKAMAEGGYRNGRRHF
jgi:hypothetical protein